MSSCPCCGHTGGRHFYRGLHEPMHSTLLMPTRERALAYPRADIELALCASCGFIWNSAFNGEQHEYSSQCEESQGYSPTFQRWQASLARQLVERYDIRRRTVLEIGCGKGDFLELLCQLGDNRCIGYDPAYIPTRRTVDKGRMRVHQQFWRGEHGTHQADVIVCRHTLEHIPDVAHFLGDVRRAIDPGRDCLVFFEVPDMQRVLDEGAFQDIYYEHCSYFCQGPLENLFQRCGFEVLECELDFHDQYLCLIARPTHEAPSPASPVDQIDSAVIHFERRIETLHRQWQEKLEAWATARQQVVVWGGGSKAVAFLNRVDHKHRVQRVIDINPNKHDAFIPGSGQPVLSPSSLSSQAADVVIVMNPVYVDEIRQHLAGMGLYPEVQALS